MIDHPDIEARDYQIRIVEKSIDFIKEFYKKKARGEVRAEAAATLLIISPTGSGKTIMGQAILKKLEEGIVNDEKMQALWMAHRRELLKQADKTNNDIFNIPGFETMSMFDKNPERYHGEKKIVLIDEAQHDAATSAIAVHNAVKPEVIIGLTATPYRVDRAKLCFEKVIRDAGIHELIRMEYLAPFNYNIMNGDWTPENVTRAFMTQPDEWGPSVSYFLRVEEAIEMAERLRAEGIVAESVTGNAPRDEILEAYHAGEIQHLSNCMVLTEGFDAPHMKTAFVRPSSKGPTIQMAGRAFRKHPTTPYVNIVQNDQTKFPFPKHATPIAQFQEIEPGVWRSLDSKQLQPLIEKMILQKAVTKIDPLPQMLTKSGSFGMGEAMQDLFESGRIRDPQRGNQN